ncbi:hypothetical protein ABZ897_42115 [Nonomuraea sp. NPDC046802]|uniref:hypothetical protein n=1 Tax=Nonomuraea sp. NPDC046802 TaxID=3154919 RepID=UPI0033D0E551
MTVLDGATGKQLSSVPLALSDNRFYAQDRPTVLERDGDQRQPVAVIRHMRVTPASGFQGEQTQYGDLVVDGAGRTVWQSPPRDGQNGHTDFRESGYLVRATFGYSGEGPGHVLAAATTVTNASGAQVTTLDGPDARGRSVYGALTASPSPAPLQRRTA